MGNMGCLRIECATSYRSPDAMILDILDWCNLGINQLVLDEQHKLTKNSMDVIVIKMG